MADEIPTVQILDKKNYFQQTLVPFPNALPYPPLGPSSLRLRTTVLSLTVNNFTYAALGTLLNWWDVHPLPKHAGAIQRLLKVRADQRMGIRRSP